MNTIALVGTLTRDPEMKNAGKTQVCEMNVVESNANKSSPLSIDVAAFGRLAETCGRYLKKGRLVAVAGQLRFREWEDREGAMRLEYSVAADRVDFLPGGQHDTASGEIEAEGE